MESIFQSEKVIVQRLAKIFGLGIDLKLFDSIKNHPLVKSIATEEDIMTGIICMLTLKEVPYGHVFKSSTANDNKLCLFVVQAECTNGVMYAAFQLMDNGLWDGGEGDCYTLQDVQCNLGWNFENLNTIQEPNVVYKFFWNLSEMKVISKQTIPSSPTFPLQPLPSGHKTLRQSSILHFVTSTDRKLLASRSSEVTCTNGIGITPTTSRTVINETNSPQSLEKSNTPFRLITSNEIRTAVQQLSEPIKSIVKNTKEDLTTSTDNANVAADNTSLQNETKLKVRETKSETRPLYERVVEYFTVIGINELSRLKRMLEKENGHYLHKNHNFLISYNSARERFFAVDLPHLGDGEGLIICRYSTEQIPICLNRVERNQSVCNMHRDMDPEEKYIIRYVDLLQDWLRTFSSNGSITSESISYAVTSVRRENHNAVTLDSSIVVTTRENSIVFYSLLNNYSLTRLCGFQGCMKATPFLWSPSCRTHDFNIRHYSVKVLDDNNKTVIYYTTLSVSSATETSKPEFRREIYKELVCYQKERVDAGSFLKAIVTEPMVFDNQSDAIEMTNCRLVARILKSMKLCPKDRPRFLHEKIEMPRKPRIFREQFASLTMRISKGAKLYDKRPRQYLLRFKEAERIKLPKCTSLQNHCFHVVTTKKKAFAGATTLSSVIDPRIKTLGSPLYLAYRKKEIVSEEILCISRKFEASKHVQVLVMLSHLLICAHKLNDNINSSLNTEFLLVDLGLDNVDLEELSVVLQLLTNTTTEEFNYIVEDTTLGDGEYSASKVM